jgi:hypothetical protein
MSAVIAPEQPQGTTQAKIELLSFQQSPATAGWAVTEPVVDADTIGELRARVAELAHAGRGGARNLLDDRRIAGLAAAPAVPGMNMFESTIRLRNLSVDGAWPHARYGRGWRVCSLSGFSDCG